MKNMYKYSKKLRDIIAILVTLWYNAHIKNEGALF